ncbi:response regulator [Celerinatantimonas yamalensis]|uniref:Response regulator n=1 Tax=Celerinatantimonas yamalensis TaxID=559956 RepID=A0ABW9G5J8_9GAMM
MERLSLSELTILLVEPSQTQRNIIHRQLHEAGVDRFLFAHNCESAYDIAVEKFPDLVISAMYFNDGTATDLIEQLRENSLLEATAYMLISSEDKFHSLDIIRQAGVVAILPKPFQFLDLKNALRSTLSFIEPEEHEDVHEQLQTLSVLVVDDSSTARRHISRVLQNLGISDIRTADNGQHGLLELNQRSADLIISDYNMPVMDGAAFVEALRQSEMFRHIPVMMVTSENDVSKLNGIRQSGVSALVDKPFDITGVKQMILAMLN